jgi:cell division protein FtsB
MAYGEGGQKSKSELRDENKQLRQTVDDLRKTVNLLTEKVHYLLSPSVD